MNLRMMAALGLTASAALIVTIVGAPAFAKPLPVDPPPTCSQAFQSLYFGSSVGENGNYSVKITYTGLATWIGSTAGTQQVYYLNTANYSNVYGASAGGGNFTLNPKQAQSGKVEDDIKAYNGKIACIAYFSIEPTIINDHQPAAASVDAS